MSEVRTTAVFTAWLEGLRDGTTRHRIQARIDRLEVGNPGQHRVLTGGVCEMKIDFGPGYRVYYAERGKTVMVLLCGGDKGSQAADIEQALALAKEL